MARKERMLSGEEKEKALDKDVAEFRRRHPNNAIPDSTHKMYLDFLFDYVEVIEDDDQASSPAPGLDSRLGEDLFIQEESETRVRMDKEQWRRMEEDQQDRVRYVLEQRAEEDPDFSWPSWIPREDAHGPIRSRRSMDDKTWGPSVPSEYDQYLDEQIFRDDPGPRLDPGDHSSGADR